MPDRLQRRRTPGWRMPPGAVYVGRPTKWGNPYLVVPAAGFTDGQPGSTVVATAGGAWVRHEQTWDDPMDARRAAVGLFADWFRWTPQSRWVATLTGRDLACWCAPGSPCHADVLLDLANGESADA